VNSSLRHLVLPCLVLLSGLILAPVSGTATPRRVLLHVRGLDLPGGRSDLTALMLQKLTRQTSLRITPTTRLSDEMPTFPESSYDLDTLIDWGREVGGRYLVDIRGTYEGIRTRKTFSIPLILHRYETAAVIEGEMRVIDLQRQRLVYDRPFAKSVRARQVVQADPDQDGHDADLHVPTSEKQDLYRRLETRLAEHLVTRLHLLSRGR